MKNSRRGRRSAPRRVVVVYEGVTTMRFMIMHKNDPHTEAGEKPGPELMAKMGAFIGEHAQRGTFLDGQGLGQRATRTRLTFCVGCVSFLFGSFLGVFV